MALAPAHCAPSPKLRPPARRANPRGRGEALARRLRVLALAGSVAGLLAAAPAQAFEVFRHAAMGADVLGRLGVGGATVEFVKQGEMSPDISGCLTQCYCPVWLQVLCSDPTEEEVLILSSSHFDNTRLVQSIAHVNATVTIARSRLLSLPRPFQNDQQRNDYAIAMRWFGEALHTLQDFYSHSTYLECFKDVIRLSGNVASLGTWEGEDLACSVEVGGTTVDGLQTGYVDLAIPEGSVGHDILNKDKPTSTQGALQIRRVFPNTLIATYYEAVSGQFGGSGPYTDAGVAPRHTAKAWQALLEGTAVYDLYPIAKQAGPRDPRLVQAERQAILDLIAEANADPYLQDLAARINTLMTSWDPDDPSTFPLDQFDEDMLPITNTAAPSDRVTAAAGIRLLEQNSPNPFNPATSIPFVAPEPSQVRLAVYDAKGRLVRVLLDQAMPAGRHQVTWDGTDDAGRPVVSGAYFYRLCVDDRGEMRRMVLAR